MRIGGEMTRREWRCENMRGDEETGVEIRRVRVENKGLQRK